MSEFRVGNKVVRPGAEGFEVQTIKTIKSKLKVVLSFRSMVGFAWRANWLEFEEDTPNSGGWASDYKLATLMIRELRARIISLHAEISMASALIEQIENTFGPKELEEVIALLGDLDDTEKTVRYMPK